ncbi:MAG TPA: PEP-CTERM sorting domain-containing protein [Candidatus Paceibacterota bacterium]|nr:PEP-CTERM sorting domain-containing protein [Candidatus Paceibacterota bacterium]
MKKFRLLSLAVASLFALSTARAATFDDIQFWTGSGANQAALVIDWNDGKSAESLVWGFRWDGTATGMDMFQAIVNADTRLFAHVSPSGSFGVAVFGIGYDLNGNGNFGVTPGLTFDAGGLSVGGYATADDTRTATDAADHWLEGWNSGSWGYYNKASADALWSSDNSGASFDVLGNGSWSGFSFAFGAWPNTVYTDPSAPNAAPVPEPGTLSLLIAGGMLVLCARRNRH